MKDWHAADSETDEDVAEFRKLLKESKDRAARRRAEEGRQKSAKDQAPPQQPHPGKSLHHRSHPK